jgi:uncharacterized membrane protein
LKAASRHFSLSGRAFCPALALIAGWQASSLLEIVAAMPLIAHILGMKEALPKGTYRTKANTYNYISSFLIRLIFKYITFYEAIVNDIVLFINIVLPIISYFDALIT